MAMTADEILELAKEKKKKDVPTADDILSMAQQESSLSDVEKNAATLFPGSYPLVSGVKQGFQNFKSGVKQLAAQATGDQEAFQREQEEIAKRDAKVDELGMFAQGGSLVGETAPSAVLPGGPAGGAAKRFLGGVASDVAASIADPVREGQTREGNLKAVAAGSGLLRGAGGFATAVQKRFSNARAGNIKNPDIADLVKSADQEEIRLFFDDATQAPLAQKLSVAAEYFGALGTGRGRRLQGDEAAAAASRWLKAFAGDADDYAEVVQSGLENKLRLFQRSAARRYAQVAKKISDKTGGLPVDVKTPGFDSAIDRAIATETAKGGRANPQVLKLLNDYRNSPRGDFESMIEFRSDFGGDIANLYESGNRPNKTAGEAIKMVREALDNDMDKFASSLGVQKDWRAANRFYRDNIVQFKEGKLKAFLNDKSSANFDRQAAWKYLAQNSTNPARAKRMWRALDAKGRAGVRAGLISEAVDAATKDGAPFSPARFASSLEKRLPVANEFFRGRSGDELRGLIKVMRHIERAGQFAENPPTGNRVVPFLLAGGAAFEPGSVATATGGALGIQALFQTETGRNLLLAASKETPGSAKFNSIMEKIERTVARSISSEDRTQ